MQHRHPLLAICISRRLRQTIVDNRLILSLWNPTPQLDTLPHLCNLIRLFKHILDLSENLVWYFWWWVERQVEMVNLREEFLMSGVEHFAFKSGETLLSSGYLVVLVPILYLATISGFKRVAELYSPGGKGFDLRGWVIFHNASLSLISGLLLMDMIVELAKMFSDGGFWSVYCDPDGRWTSGRIYFYLFVNYVLKYVELIDTFLLALRGKPTPFLHVYHHSATLILCLTQLRGQTSPQWLVVTINLFVHVVMYLYYCLAALGYRVWWKRYITVLQIAQFVIVVTFCGLGFLLTPMHGIGLIEKRCHGDVASQTFGMAILVSYLFLFLAFYDRTYKKSE